MEGEVKKNSYSAHTVSNIGYDFTQIIKMLFMSSGNSIALVTDIVNRKQPIWFSSHLVTLK